MATLRKLNDTSRHTYVVRNHRQDADPAFGDPIQLSSEEWRTLCLASETPRILPPSVLNVFAKRK